MFLVFQVSCCTSRTLDVAAIALNLPGRLRVAGRAGDIPECSPTTPLPAAPRGRAIRTNTCLSGPRRTARKTDGGVRTYGGNGRHRSLCAQTSATASPGPRPDGRNAALPLAPAAARPLPARTSLFSAVRSAHGVLPFTIQQRTLVRCASTFLVLMWCIADQFLSISTCLFVLYLFSPAAFWIPLLQTFLYYRQCP